MIEDEKIILHCLKFIRRATKYLPSGHVNMLTTLWKNWNEDKQNYFHGALWDKKYVHLAPYQWELQLTDAGKDFIKEKDKELEGDFFYYLATERDVQNFMIDNFVKPDDLSPYTKNETDDGVVFLRDLKKRRLIKFDDGILEQVINWEIPKGRNKHKRWFDTLTEKLIVVPINPHQGGVLLEKEPLIKPKIPQSIPQRIKTHIDIAWLVRNLKKLSIKNIIEMTIAGLVVGAAIGWLIWYFGYNDVRIHQPTGAPRKIEAKKTLLKKEG
ncbi:MAG TPA: hypothetical protein VNX40_11005 [Mucilaginibacter sp.]|jgi:hypothetical protein|nr:hypothetical protein [Mucilaginibacter sp.]